MYVYILKITAFLWIIVILLHPGLSSLLLETATAKFGGTEKPKAKDRHMGLGTLGREKQKPLAW